MKLDLKQLRAHPGERLAFHERTALHESDFHEPVILHGALEVEGWAVWRPQEVVELELALAIELDQVCSRCLTPVAKRIAHREQLALRGTPELQLLADAFSYVIGEPQIDLTPILVGFVLEHLDAKPLCRPDCLGICPVCGADRNRAPCACETRARRDPRLAALERWLKP